MNILAGVIGAAISLVGVLLGVWLNGRREERKWMRDNKLQSATQFIAAVGSLYNHLRKGGEAGLPPELRAEWDEKVQSSRAAVHLLCDQPTIDRMEELSVIVWKAEPGNAKQHEASIEALRAFTRSVRQELAGRSTGR